MDEKTRLPRTTIATLYAHRTGDVADHEADAVMFAIDDHLAEHDPEWRKECHDLAGAAENNVGASRSFGIWVRRVIG